MKELVKMLHDAGIVGAGGAGFPTHVKMNGKIDTLLINGAECEPLLQVDKNLMMTYTSELIEGITFIMEELDINQCIIGVKNKYSKIIQSLEEHSFHNSRIRIHPLPNIYPIGDEVVLIQETTGVVLKRSELPISKGFVVLNIETLLNIYKKKFAETNVIHSYVTVIGEVEKPGTYVFPIGTQLSYIIDMVKPKVNEYEVIVGEPMTGTLAKDHEVVKKNTKGYIVLPKDHNLIHNMEDVNMVHLKRIMASCSQCRACTDMCPRHLLGHEVEPHKLMNAMANGLTGSPVVLKTALGCVNCGVCELYACHHDLSPRKMMVAVKQAYAKEGIRPTTEGCKDMHLDREYRKVPASRLIKHLHLSAYDQHVEAYYEPVEVKKVVIPLHQHIGAPSKPIVAVGDKVNVNQRIGENQEKQLGAHIHASISGTVTAIHALGITIERNR